jgi:proteasome lid subunit RPN8/RPN11
MFRSDRQPFGAAVDSAIMAHALADRRHEICGVVTDTPQAGEFAYHRLCNSAAEPARRFVIDPAALLDLPPVRAVVHSHPAGPAWPSPEDMRQAQADDVPWGIVVPRGVADPGLFWFGGDIMPSLTGRGYRHGVTDCYALVRDWFRTQQGLFLIDRPRAWEWWEGGDDLYIAHFAESGFVRLEADATPRRGDVALAAVPGPVINHALVYLGQGLVLHHLAGRHGHDPARLPRREPAERWRGYIRFWARHPEMASWTEATEGSDTRKEMPS